MSSIRFLAASVGLACSFAGDVFANRYTIIDLGAAESPVAINRNDQVAANTAAHRGLRGQILRGGKWHNLPAHSIAVALNRSGDVAGETRDNRPMLWPHNEAPVVLKLPSGAILGAANGINKEDAIVGYYQASDESAQCFLWTPTEGSEDFGAPFGLTTCTALGVSDTIYITGRASTSAHMSHAFLWTKQELTDLGTLSGDASSEGRAVNAAGQVVGVSYPDEGSRAFLWNGALINLDPERKYFISVAASINKGGDVVGWTQASDRADEVAVRFAHGKILKLNSEIVELDDWKLRKAVSVNDKGAIVGVGERSLTGQIHGFMLVPE